MSQNDHHEEEKEFSFKSLFVPLTTLKAIHMIIIVGFLVYGNMLFNGIVWDDSAFIFENPQMHSFDLINAFGSNLSNGAGFYRPLHVIYYSLIYSVFHDNIFFYHLIQLLLHIVNTCLIFILFKSFFRRGVSLLLVLIFLVHTMNVESVSLISGALSPLSSFFGLFSLTLLLRKKYSLKIYFIMGICLLLSLLAKEEGLLYIILSLGYILIFNKEKFKTVLFTESLVVSIYFFLRLVWGKANFLLLKINSDVNSYSLPIMRLSTEERWINVPQIIFYYIKTVVFPYKLSIDQLWLVSSVNVKTFYFPLFVDLTFFSILFGFAYFLFRKSKKELFPYLFFFFWFLLGMMLYSQILFPLDMTVADRWFYFPLIGLLGVIGITIEYFSKFKKAQYFIFMMLILIISLLSFRTMIRNTNFYNDITLYTHDAQVHDNYELELNLGAVLFLNGETDKAIIHFKKSVDIFPFEVNLYNLAYAYDAKKDFETAKKYYIEALKYPHYTRVKHKHTLGLYQNLSGNLLKTDEPDKAKEFIRTALKEYPEDGLLWMLLAVSEYRLGNNSAAIMAAEKATILLPDPLIKNMYLQIKNKEPIDL